MNETTHRTATRTVRFGWVVCIAVVAAMTSCAALIPTRAGVDRTVEPLVITCGTAGSSPNPAPTSVTALGRSARLIAPANFQPGIEYPLLVSLHPFTLDAQAWEDYSGLGAAASQRGYWVLLPRGSEPGPRWSVPGGLESDADDIAWIDELIQTTASTVCVDGERIFAAGYSAGAAMAVGLSCELPGRFAGIAGSGGTNLTSLCPDAAPVDALIMHGTADPVAPWQGSEVIFAPPLGISVDAVVSSFAQRNGCAGATSFNISATVKVDRYGCETARLDLFTMNGAGHTWAGSNPLFSFVVGATDTSFSATNAVLDFFEDT